jgi:glycosyltransferase involved in cell wall biosynthesis
VSERTPSLPSASVVVPITNGWEATFRCVLALAERSAGVRREFIVVDNGSSDETRLALPRLEGLRIIRNERDEGFVRACNQAAAEARGDVLVFLDRDAEVGSGWLERLARHFADEDVAAVGPPESLAGAFLAVRTAEYGAQGGLDEKSPAAADDLLTGFLRRGRRIEIAEDVPVAMPRANAQAAPAPRAPVSIVLPVRNGADTLAACLEAIEPNLGPGDEVVIADGGSEDDTLRHAFEFAARHHRRVKVMDDPGGVAGALRRGLAAATRDLTLVAHPRVAMPVGFLDGMLRLLADHANAGALAVEAPLAGLCVLGRSGDLRAVAGGNVNALFKADGVTLGRALRQLGTQLAYVPAPVGKAA